MRNTVISDSGKHTALSQTKPSSLDQNAQVLTRELAWCDAMIQARLQAYFSPNKNKNESMGKEGRIDQSSLPNPPLYSSDYGSSLSFQKESQGPYADFIFTHELNSLSRLMLAFAMASELKPSLFDVLLSRNETTGLNFFEFGMQLEDDRPYATGETLAFILFGTELVERFKVQGSLQALIQMDSGTLNLDKSGTPSQASLSRVSLSGLSDVLALDKSQSQSMMQVPLKMQEEALYRFTSCRPYRPESSPQFPAQYIDTQLDWDQLVLPQTVMTQVSEIQAYVAHGDQLMKQWHLGGKIRPGYRALFYGPPGTGKTLAASLLGKVTGHDVYRVDISLMVSKYIGETEKNLSKVFAMAENKKWILFFDEADALFGKRNQANSANDQFANQNVAYLLQRIENFNGVVILASNLKDNLDEAFFRRFESMVYFSLPEAEERLQLWQKSFSDVAQLEAKIDLVELARKYPLSGANIINVIRYASMQSILRASAGADLRHTTNYGIYLADLEYAIGKELEAYADSGVLLKGHNRPF